jgi:hypothetical protein
MTETCANCRFWDAFKESTQGICRRHAPRPFLAGQDAPWPITDTEEWCGEWQPLPGTPLEPRRPSPS